MLHKVCIFIKSITFIFQLYRNPMLHELGLPKTWVDKMFPQLDELTSIHLVFLHELQELQNRRPDRSVDDIGHVLYDQVKNYDNYKSRKIIIIEQTDPKLGCCCHFPYV